MELFDALRQPCAEIVVGTPDNSETFYLHKKLLCDSSSYFKAALNNGFAETTSQKITLDDEDPAVFRIFASWLYHPIIVLPSEDLHTQEEHLLKLYLFADKRGIVNLANDAITMLASCWVNYRVVKSKTNWIFSEILASSKLYDLILDSMFLELRYNSPDISRLNAADLPKPVLIDLLKREMRYRRGLSDFDACILSACHYHVHGPDGVLTEAECVETIEKGHNIWRYESSGDYTQIPWNWDQDE
ncbi:hypothetical protein D6D15_06900 [Aureobasidium pullulans]|uniref:BTB domain-containing protein n=1 Tax=Aureobasidium pullulans TaxID=5580 RepID=A0A4S9B341_AURPU|nr:hypothetical protein D6D15_06900 [Aureobasidium pullulans]